MVGNDSRSIGQTDADDYGPSPDTTVYLVQQPTVPKGPDKKRIDTTPLYQHGKVTVLLDPGQNAYYNSAASRLQMKERLKTFDPDRDYIAVAGGDSLGVLLVGSILTEMGFDHFFYLRWERTLLPNGQRDPVNGSYIPLLVPLSDDVTERMIGINQ